MATSGLYQRARLEYQEWVESSSASVVGKTGLGDPDTLA